jgi:hypothetical protein
MKHVRLRMKRNINTKEHEYDRNVTCNLDESEILLCRFHLTKILTCLEADRSYVS